MAVEFRGVKNLVIAEVTKDDETGYATGSVISLAPVAEISKSVETSSAAHYYDNKAAIIINSEGEDTVTFTIAVPDDETFALITGRTFNSHNNTYIESERVQRYFAVGYVLGEVGEGEDERYVWRYKGTFNIPDETSATVDNGTDANNLSLVFTGIYTNFEFENGKGAGVAGSAKAMFIRKSTSSMDAAIWFARVTTPDNMVTGMATVTIRAATNTTITVIRNDNEVFTTGRVVNNGDTLQIFVTGGTLTVNGEAFDNGDTLTVSGAVTIASTAD